MTFYVVFHESIETVFSAGTDATDGENSRFY